MKFSFLRASKSSEPTVAPTMVAPPRVTTPKSTPPTPAPTSQAARSSFDTGQQLPTVQLRLGSILPQLPPQLFSNFDRATLSAITLAIPGELILPQLATGKITVRILDLVPLLPPNLLGNTLPQGSDRQTVVLPLAEIIAAVPPELLTRQHDSAIAVDTAEFNKFPKLFDDSLLEETTAINRTSTRDDLPAQNAEPPAREHLSVPSAAETARATARVMPGQTAADVQTEEPVVQSAPVQSFPVSEMPEQVAVSLRSLVSAMPDHVFSCPRAELWRKADFDSRVLLPVQPLLPQLKTAHLQLPLATVLAAMPQSLLANPLPPIGDEVVPLPLAEIISQLPSLLFNSELRKSDEQEFELEDVDIPEPFHERGTQFADDASTSELPQDQPAFTDATLHDETLEVFLEKVAPVEVPGIEPLEELATDLSETQPITPVVSAPPPEKVTASVELPEIPVPQEEQEQAPEPAIAEISQPTPAEPVTESVIESEEVITPSEIPAVVSEQEVPEQVFEPTAAEATEPPSVETTPAPVELAAQTETPAPQSAQESTEEIEGIDDNKFLIDLNRCTVEDLQGIQGIGPALARRIVEFRNECGQFRSLKELRHVPGIGQKVFHALAGVQPRALNRLLGVEHNNELSLQEIIQLTAAQPGVEGCMLAMSDGLFLTGKLPPHLDQNAISVFAPQLFKKVGRYVRELKVGQVRRFTIFTDQQPMSIFRAGEVYLIIIHDQRHFSKALLRRCERISEEIARLCRQRAVV